MKFCPVCHSVIIDGKCSNKSCNKQMASVDSFKLYEELKTKFGDKQFKLLDEAVNLISTNKDYSFDEMFDSDEPNAINSMVTVKELKTFGIPISLKIITDSKTEKDGYEIMQLKECSLKECRGKTTRIYPYNIKFTVNYSISAKYSVNYKEEHYFGSYNMENWKYISNQFSQCVSDDLLYQFGLMCGFIYYLAKHWLVYIKEPNISIGLNQIIEKEQAYEIFRLRDIKDGRKRRTALEHIVNSYERKKPKQTIVPEYFRGDEVFNWDGFICKLTPSLKDKTRIKKERSLKRP